MQGLADGYFVLPYTIDYLAPDIKTGEISTDLPEFVEAENNVKARIERFITNNGTHLCRLFIRN
jgi:succinate dehydrogenase / fumarate reductase flavoprotein subunit